MALTLQILAVCLAMLCSGVHGGDACAGMGPEMPKSDSRGAGAPTRFTNSSGMIQMCHKGTCNSYKECELEKRFPNLWPSDTIRSSSNLNIFFPSNDLDQCCPTILNYVCPILWTNVQNHQCWIIQWPSPTNDGRCQVLAQPSPCKPGTLCRKKKGKCVMHKRIVSMLAWCPFTNPWPASFGWYFFRVDSHCKCSKPSRPILRVKAAP